MVLNVWIFHTYILCCYGSFMKILDIGKHSEIPCLRASGIIVSDTERIYGSLTTLRTLNRKSFGSTKFWGDILNTLETRLLQVDGGGRKIVQWSKFLQESGSPIQWVGTLIRYRVIQKCMFMVQEVNLCIKIVKRKRRMNTYLTLFFKLERFKENIRSVHLVAEHTIERLSIESCTR